MAQSYNPRKVAVAIVVLVLLVYGAKWLFGSSDGFSPEEINSMLQNKEGGIVKIKKIELTAQGLYTPYLEPSTYRINNWDVAGNTLVKNTEYIRLTSDNKHQVGNMFGKEPIQAQSFEMELTFHIHSKSSSLLADGFAIWFLDSKSDIGDVFGSKNYFTGLGIMVDTYKNGKRGQFPYVNLMLGDGKTHYSKYNDGYDTRLAGCSASSITNPTSGFTKARIVYLQDGYFSLDFNYDGKQDHWVNCVTLTDVHLPIIKYLGLSAETGELSQSVDIIENKIYALYKPDGSFISNFDELHSLIAQQDKDQRDQVSKDGVSHPQSPRSKPKRQTRKSLQRLYKAEQRIKERERQRKLETYGDPEMYWFKYMFFKLLNAMKYLIYAVLGVIVIWFLFIAVRVSRQNKKSKTTGLLD
ncbi:hypothetical protein PSN45_001995 [Yamadazyma tenuis]|uniref:Concanavalin A-like lectin/glucanase n=1 Tax=Candida tenuis (strain ATCC 10573 / BCRC 21748 / CBS 615 / JCM 9827 / NBRC 10315 / NRRL Y-1498 / VKM Y-70) TaxID=590646 RepID=G3BD67_CANTC|nr:concanavalin A-like lectin/glucanase [Yamadazyma tenuis ATCC 10573]EGV60252.1 concanavalin A-like lectin/glucanase [Yamadazyma tenuis ATCC 10573]WEJ94506.1 hypothetical protein PSN45_001995 [Yamadazyma tenuis]